MFWTVVRKEILSQVLSIRFSVSVILALLFLIPSTYILATDYGWDVQDRGAKAGFDGSGTWYMLHREIPPLRILATGLDKELSLTSGSPTHKGPEFNNDRQFVHNPLRYLFSQLDFVFFVNIVGGLMTFIFIYDAVSGEKQAQTLRLVMTSAIKRPTFLLAKFLGGYASFVISLAPGLVGGALVIYLHPDVAFGPSEWRTAAFLVSVSLLYFAAFCMLGLFISCITATPKTTLTALMMLWVILVLVIPNFSPFLAAKLRPAQSLYDAQKQSSGLINALRQSAQTKREAFMQQHGGEWDALSEEKKQEARRLWRKEYRRPLMNLTAGEIAKLKRGFINDMQAQVKVSHYISFISPSAALTYLAGDIARTGLETERHFRRAVFRYRGEYMAHVDRYIERTGDYGRLRTVDPDDSPPFDYHELSVAQVIAAHLPRVMVLILYTVLCFFGAQVAFIRAQL